MRDTHIRCTDVRDGTDHTLEAITTNTQDSKYSSKRYRIVLRKVVRATVRKLTPCGSCISIRRPTLEFISRWWMTSASTCLLPARERLRGTPASSGCDTDDDSPPSRDESPDTKFMRSAPGPRPRDCRADLIPPILPGLPRSNSNPDFGKEKRRALIMVST